MSKTILLVSHRADDVSFVAEVSQVAGAKLEVGPDAAQAAQLIAKFQPIAIFIDVTDLKYLETFEFEVQKRFGLFSDDVSAARFHFIGDRPLQENRDVIKSPFFGSYFERPSNDLEESAKLYGRFVGAGESMATHDLNHFLIAGVKTQTITLVRSEQKQEAVEAVRQYLIEVKLPSRIANSTANAIDELLMNALFDAPTDAFGGALYSSTGRHEARELSEREQVKMSIGFDGFNFGLSITDFFGSIDRARLLSHVSRDYRGQAGGRFGLAAVFNSGGSLIYHCEAGQKTEVTLLYRAFSDFRDIKSQFCFFSAKYYV